MPDIERKPMTEESLSNLVKNKIENSIGGYDSSLSTLRGDAMEYYLNEPKGNEQEGRSDVNSTDVSDTIERIMPELMRIFESGGKAVEFQANGEEDVDIAKLATEYCDFVYRRDNNSYINTTSFIKDGLIQKTGILKIYWDEFEEINREKLQGVSEDELTLILEDENIEIYDQEEIEQPPMIVQGEDGAPTEVEMPPVYNVTLQIKKTIGKVRVEPVPPEEFIIDRNGRYLDMNLTGANHCGHRVPRTISDLRDDGVDEKILDTLMEWDEETAFSDEAEARRKNDESYWQLDDGSDDPAARQVYIYEMYIHVDFDGDGLTELRKIITAGDSHEIISNEEVDYIPFAIFSPILMPHRIVGRGVAELVMEIEDIKTSLIRQYLDNVYAGLNQSTVINDENVNLDDMLESAPNRIIRTDGMPSQDVMALPVQWMGNDILTAMQYMDGVITDRTGVSDATNGMSAEVLANANTGVMATFIEKSQATIELIARTIAEVGFKQVFKIILRLSKDYQDNPRMIELNGKWQEVDPSQWPTSMDVKVNVGLGTGNKDKKLIYLKDILDVQKEAIGFGLATPEQIYNTLSDGVEAMGLSASRYFQLPPPPDPNAPQPKDQATIMAEAEVEKQSQRTKQDHEEMVNKTIIDLQKLAIDAGIGLEDLPAFIFLREQEEQAHQQKMGQQQMQMMQMQQAQQQQGPI